MSHQVLQATRISALGNAYLHADTSLEFQLQSDHVHFFHCAELIKLRNFLGHLVNRHLNRIQFCAWLAYNLDSLLHIREQVTRCTRAIQEDWKFAGEWRAKSSPEGLDGPVASLCAQHIPSCIFLCMRVIFYPMCQALSHLLTCASATFACMFFHASLAMSSFSELD